MSTKIYNGYRIPMMSFKRLHELAGSVMETVRSAAETAACQRATALAVEILDSIRLGEPLPQFATQTIGKDRDWTVKGVSQSFALHRQAAARKSDTRDPAYDFDFSLTFIPCGRKILTLCYSEQFEHLWKAFPGVEEYGYWNNTDKPETVSNVAWRRRAKDWDAAVGDDAPCMRGFTIEAWGKYNGPHATVEARLQPAFKRRVEAASRDRLLRTYQSELGEPMTVERYMGFRGWMKEHQELVADATAAVSEILPRRWKQADFERVIDEAAVK